MPDLNASKVSRITWHEIAKVGHPAATLRTCENGAPRHFLVRGEYTLACAYVFDDGSGFDLPSSFEEKPLAWAVIEGF